MGWFRRLFGDQPTIELTDLMRELEALRTQVQELARHDAVLKKVDALEMRLAALELTEEQDVAALRGDCVWLRDRVKYPKEDVDESNWWRPFERQFTKGGVAVVFIAAAVIMSFGVGFFYFTKHPKEALDYAAYVLPCCAAIAAGLTVYLDDHKGALFILSLFLLFFGMDASLMGLVDTAESVGYTTLLTVGLIDMGLVVLAWRGIRRECKKKREGEVSHVGKEIAAHGLVLLIVIPLTIYAGFYTYENFSCIHAGATLSDCHGAWEFWGVPRS